MTRLEAIRLAFDTAVAEAEDSGAAPEGIATIVAARVLYEYECACARIAENTPTLPEAAWP